MENSTDWYGETSNEASLSGNAAINGYVLRKTKPSMVEDTLSIPIPDKENLPLRWATGERISGPAVMYSQIPGSLFKYAIYIEGKYSQSVVGILRLVGYDNNDNTDSVDHNLEVIKRSLFNSSYSETYSEVYFALEALKNRALAYAKDAKTPEDYRELRKSFPTTTDNFNENSTHGSPIKRRKEVRGSRVGSDTTEKKSTMCRHAHRFPTMQGMHNDLELVGRIACEKLHMRLNEEKDVYELCSCNTDSRGAPPMSLFSHVTAAVDSKGKGKDKIEVQYEENIQCSSCQAIKENMATHK